MVTGASIILTSNASTPVEVVRLPADLRFEKQITIELKRLAPAKQQLPTLHV